MSNLKITVENLEYLKIFATKMLKELENNEQLKVIDVIALDHSLLEIKIANNITDF